MDLEINVHDSQALTDTIDQVDRLFVATKLKPGSDVRLWKTGYGLTANWEKSGAGLTDGSYFGYWNKLSPFSPPYTMDFLTGYNWGFAIPPGAEIKGIEITWHVLGNSTAYDNYVFLATGVTSSTSSGTFVGDDKKKVSSDVWVSYYSDRTYGKSNDLWGTTLTASDLNDSGFGISISATQPASAGIVAYWVTMNIYYQIDTFEVHDTLSISEAITMEHNQLNVFDTLTFSEIEITVRTEDMAVSVHDEIINIDELVFISLDGTVLGIDEGTITESIIMHVSGPLEVYDDLSITESFIYAEEGVAVVQDNLSLSDNVTVVMEDCEIQVVDIINEVEDFNSELLRLINVFDSLTITESFSDEVIYRISVFDVITITEVIFDSETIFDIIGLDELTISDGNAITIERYIDKDDIQLSKYGSRDDRMIMMND